MGPVSAKDEGAVVGGLVAPSIRIDRPGIAVEIFIGVVIEKGRHIAGIIQIEGKIALPPKEWVKAVRAEMVRLEAIARNAGCAELRIAGRKQWATILPDYKPMTDAPNVRNGLRKVLA